jgi:hypothetical protein
VTSALDEFWSPGGLYTHTVLHLCPISGSHRDVDLLFHHLLQNPEAGLERAKSPFHIKHVVFGKCGKEKRGQVLYYHIAGYRLAAWHVLYALNLPVHFIMSWRAGMRDKTSSVTQPTVKRF